MKIKCATRVKLQMALDDFTGCTLLLAGIQRDAEGNIVIERLYPMGRMSDGGCNRMRCIRSEDLTSVYCKIAKKQLEPMLIYAGQGTPEHIGFYMAAPPKIFLSMQRRRHCAPHFRVVNYK